MCNVSQGLIDKGIEKGIEKGKKRFALRAIRFMMKNNPQLSCEEIMDGLGIEKHEQSLFLSELKEGAE